MRRAKDYPWKYGTLSLPSSANLTPTSTLPDEDHTHTLVTLANEEPEGFALRLADKKAFHLGQEIWQLAREISMASENRRNAELTLIDATRALEGSGPTTAPRGQTKVRRLKTCIGGTNMLETDNAACELMGIPVVSVRHLGKVPVSLARR